MKRGIKALFVLLAVVFMAAAPRASAVEVKPEWKKDPKVLWKEMKTVWDKDVKSYQCEILGWAYKTDNYIKNFTKGKDEDGKIIEKDWTYRIYQIKFRKPNWILFKYNYSAHENTEEGSLIDRAVAYVLKFTGGTTFNYGYKREDGAFVKFPYISNSEFAKYPISVQWKAMMKVLMIASRKEIYFRPLDEIRDPRGYSVDNLIIGLTMKRFDAMFEKMDGDKSIKVETSPQFGKDDYKYDDKTGWLTLKPEAAKKTPTIMKLVFEDKNLKRSKGVNKYEAFIDPKSMMVVGLHEYESGKLVGVTQFFNMKLNVNIPESEWEEYFKGRTVNYDK
jgi:hypothetical protein